MQEFRLYSTGACHLCDVAEGLLREQQAARALRYTRVDISDSDALFERYGMRIPVLARPDGRELNWPFDAAALGDFLDS